MAWFQSLRDRVFGRKDDPTYQAYTQFLGIGSPIYTPRNYTSLAKEGYEKNITVYRSVSLIAQSCAGIPWKLYRLGQEKNQEVTSHPVLDLLANPNPTHGTASFIEDMVSFWLISGNSYVICVRPRPGAPPRELWILRPDRMSVVPGPYNIAGYDYSLDGHRQFFIKDDILHLKMFAANNDWYGLSPVSVAAALVDQQNEGFDWNTAILQNMGRPSGALVATGVLGNDQYERLRKLIRERYTGKKNAGMPMLLEGGLDWKQFSMSPLELDWMESRKQNMRDISIALGVPPELLGDSANKTYCLPYDSRVMTSQGAVEIGDIRPGMYVYSLVENKRIELKKVLWQKQTGVKMLHRISCGKHRIEATGNHPFLILERGEYQYRQAADLRLGDFLVHAYSYPGMMDSRVTQHAYWDYTSETPECCEILPITALELLPPEPVYDIEVEDSHNFFAEHFCVHNSNYQEARKSFYQETILPLMDKLRDRLNVWLLPQFGDDGLELRYDKEEVEALQEDRESLSSRLMAQWNAGIVTLNEVRDQLGLSELPGGDILQVLVQGHVFIPSDQLEQYVEAKLENLVAPPPPPQPGQPAPDLHLPDNGSGPEDTTSGSSLTAQQPATPKPPAGQSTGNPSQANPAVRGVPGASEDDETSSPWEMSYSAPPPREKKSAQSSLEEQLQKHMEKYFQEEYKAVSGVYRPDLKEKDLLAQIKSAIESKRPVIEGILKDQYNVAGKQRAKEIWTSLKKEAKAKKPVQKKPDPDQGISDALQQWLDENPVDLASEGDIYTLYDPNFDPTQDMYWNVATEKYFQQFAFKRINGIQSTNYDILQRSLNYGFSQKETSIQIKARIDAAYKNTIIPVRSKMVAQTETTAAFNFGGRVVAVSVSVPLNKQWITQGDAKVRPTHREADGQLTDLYEPYVVGGEKLMYPGDTSIDATAGNTVNCRCQELYSLKENNTTKQGYNAVLRPSEDREGLFIRQPVIHIKHTKKHTKTSLKSDFKTMREFSDKKLKNTITGTRER